MKDGSRDRLSRFCGSGIDASATINIRYFSYTMLFEYATALSGLYDRGLRISTSIISFTPMTGQPVNPRRVDAGARQVEGAMNGIGDSGQLRTGRSDESSKCAKTSPTCTNINHHEIWPSTSQTVSSRSAYPWLTQGRTMICRAPSASSGIHQDRAEPRKRRYHD